MKTIYSLIDDVYEKLNSIPMFGRKGRAAANFSLDSIRDFCRELGDPQSEVPAIHVAGTNGKGTTCRMLASVYQSAGYKTGLFTSPHLVEYRERFMVNAEMISEAKLLEFFQQNVRLIELKPLTYFEFSAAIAFWFFRDQNVDLAVIETGLGGRLDATNIANPVVCVITSIGLDHTDILGGTIAEIAGEKAGIIKTGRPVVTGDLPEEAVEVIKETARNKNAPLLYARPEKHQTRENISGNNQTVTKTLSEMRNEPVVRSVIRCLSEQYPVSYNQIDDGLGKWKSRYPAGVSFRKLHSGLKWYYDGAHNADAVQLLVQQLNDIAPLYRWTLVLAMMGDKLNADIAKQVSEIGRIYLYQMDSERSASTDQMRKYLPNAFELSMSDDNMLKESWIQKYKSELVIFGGSFYFYSTVKRWMGNIAE